MPVLVLHPPGAWVVGLPSLTGVFLNGQKIRLARLEDKDELRIGGFRDARPLPAGNKSCHAIPVAGIHGFRRRTHGAQAHGRSYHHGESRAQPREMTLEPVRQNTLPSERFVEPSLKAMVESVFFPMVQQFSAVQNQMFDQFQQTMALMFQMFHRCKKNRSRFCAANWIEFEPNSGDSSLQLELKAPPVGARARPLPRSQSFRRKPVNQRQAIVGCGAR